MYLFRLSFGDNGVLTQAGNAKDATAKADCLEALQRAIVSAQADFTPYMADMTFFEYLSAEMDTDGKTPKESGGKYYVLSENGYTITPDSDVYTTGKIGKNGDTKNVFKYELTQATNGDGKSTWGVTIGGAITE